MKASNRLATMWPWLEVVRDMRGIMRMPTFIAGGAIRDTLNGKPVKDVDIFTQVHTEDDFVNNLNRLSQQFGPLLSSMIPNPDYRSWNSAVVGIGRFEVVGLPPVEVIGMDLSDMTLMGLLSTFDYDICRVGLNENGVVVSTPEYHGDIQNKTITLSKVMPGTAGLEEALGRSIARYPSLKAKYPDHKLVIGPHLLDPIRAAGSLF